MTENVQQNERQVGSPGCYWICIVYPHIPACPENLFAAEMMRYGNSVLSGTAGFAMENSTTLCTTRQITPNSNQPWEEL